MRVTVKSALLTFVTVAIAASLLAMAGCAAKKPVTVSAPVAPAIPASRGMLSGMGDRPPPGSVMPAGGVSAQKK